MFGIFTTHLFAGGPASPVSLNGLFYFRKDVYYNTI